MRGVLRAFVANQLIFHVVSPLHYSSKLNFEKLRANTQHTHIQIASLTYLDA